MTTDMESELRELFREKAGEAPLATPSAPAAAPQRVLLRGRLHQVATALGSAAAVLALIVGSVAGLNALLRSDEDLFRTGERYEVFERAATIEAFTVTSPSDWYLVNEWPSSMETATAPSPGVTDCILLADGETEFCLRIDDPNPQPYGLPMLQLSNQDIGLQRIACGEDLPADMAVLHVALDHEAAAALPGIDDPSFGPWPGHVSGGTGPCGPGTYAWFTVNGEPFFAWIGFGESVSEEDRSTLLATYESLIVDDSWEPVPPAEVTPGYVIAGGVTDAGDDWRLELRPGGRNVELSLEGLGQLDVQDFIVPAIPVEWSGTDPIFGAVTKEATGVEFRPGTENEDFDLGGSPVPGTIVPLPPSLGVFDLDLFFIDPPAHYGALGGRVLALGLEGQATEPPPVAEPRSETVELTGSLNGQDWRVRFTGSFRGGESACIEVTIDGPPGHFCPDPVHTTLGGESPYFSGSFSPALHLLAGSVPPEVEQLRFFDGAGREVAIHYECQIGPLGWTNPDRKVCAIALPPKGSGTLRYNDASGVTLFQEDMGWGSAEASSDNEYPWTNEGSFITARGSFLGAAWKLEVLHYLDGYRLTIDGRDVFGDVLMVGEPVAFPLFEGERSEYDALVLVVTGTEVGSISIASEGIWEGRWIPGSTANGEQARLWVIEIPGAGTGSLRFDGVDQGTVSWP